METKEEIGRALEIIKQAPRNSKLRDILNRVLRLKFRQSPDSQYKVIKENSDTVSQL